MFLPARSHLKPDSMAVVTAKLKRPRGAAWRGRAERGWRPQVATAQGQRNGLTHMGITWIRRWRLRDGNLQALPFNFRKPDLQAGDGRLGSAGVNIIHDVVIRPENC